MAKASRARKSDRRAELLLGASAVAVLALIGFMLFTVFLKAWPSFSHNGLAWFGTGEDVDTQLRAMQTSTPLPGHSIYYFSAWPLIWGTILTTVPAMLAALVISTLAAVFVVEFAPAAMRRIFEPVIRLLAAVPSVIYGLIGILALAPLINEHLISDARKESVQGVVQLDG
ncbi:MAG TPA: ABC transporter permease, partial [Solirubrobacteraceae bacterium]|nr:ABC transporter permease [Solirubrobacteraceae bacterium]